MAITEQLQPSIISAPPPAANGEPGRWRGVNLFLDQRRIGDDELAYAQNVYPVSPEVPSKRRAIAHGGLFGGGQASGGGLINVAIFPGGGVPFQYVCWAGVGSPGAFIALPGNVAGPVLQVSNTIAAKQKACIATAKNACYMVLGAPFDTHPGIKAAADGSVPTGVGLKFFDFTDATGVVQPLAGVNAPAVAAPFGQRMVYANFGPGFEQALLFSDSLINPNIGATGAGILTAGVDPLTSVGAAPFAANGRFFFPGAQRQSNDRIVGLKEVMLTQLGGPPQAGMLVLMEYSAYLMTGQPNQSNDNPVNFPPIGTLNIERIAYDCGCASQETIVTTPYGTFWAGPDDVWLFQYGQAPMRVGSKIRPALLRTPEGYRHRWHAAYFDGAYRLAIDSPGVPIDNGSNSACGEQWWLDLRNGTPQGGPEVEMDEMGAHESAEWWGPQIYNLAVVAGPPVIMFQGTHNMFVDTVSGPYPQLCGVELGYGQHGFLARYDAQNPRDVSWLSTDPYQTIVGAEILADVRLKEWDNGDARVDKMVQQAEANVLVDSDCLLNADFNMDQGAIIDTQSTPVPATGMQIGIDPLGTPMTRQTQGIAFWPQGTKRDIGKTLQLRLYDVPGYAVLQGVNDTLIFGYQNLAGLLVAYTATVAPGLYATADLWIAALVAAMNAAAVPSGVTFSNSAGSQASGPVVLRCSDINSELYVAWAAAGLGGAHVGSPTGPLISASTFTTAQYRSSKKVAALLGLDTSGANNITGSPAIAAVAAIFAQNVPIWELNDLAVNVMPLPRRPQ